MSLRRRMAARVSFRFFLPSRRTGSRRAFCLCTGRIRWPLCPLRGRCAPLWLLRPPVGKVMLLSG